MWGNIVRNWLLIAMIFACAVSPARSAEDTAGTPPTRKEVLESYLTRAGDALNCYFTVESNSNGVSIGKKDVPETTFRFGSVYGPQAEAESIDALIEILRRGLPLATVFRNAQNPRIIHIADTALLTTKGYVIEERLNYAYNGLLHNLASDLDALTDGVIRRNNVFSFPGMEREDYTTRVNVLAENQKVRDILTLSIPLEGYNRILWRADAHTHQGELVTSLRFRGPVKKPESDSAR